MVSVFEKLFGGGKKEESAPEQTAPKIQVERIPTGEEEISPEVLKIGKVEVRPGDKAAAAGGDGAMKFNYTYEGVAPDGRVAVTNDRTGEIELFGRKLFESWQVSPEAEFQRGKQG